MHIFLEFIPHIIQPSSSTITVSTRARVISLVCSLNVTIPSSATVTWFHDGNVVMTTYYNKIIQTGNTTTLIIRYPWRSDAGVYECVFNDTVNGWMVKRNITLGLSLLWHIIANP